MSPPTSPASPGGSKRPFDPDLTSPTASPKRLGADPVSSTRAHSSASSDPVIDYLTNLGFFDDIDNDEL
jgi:hypothetical protein